MKEERGSLREVVRVKNPLGLHARPAALIARLLQKRKGTILFTYEGKQADPRSMMDLLMLGAAEGSEIVITAEGEGAFETLKALIEMFETGLVDL